MDVFGVGQSRMTWIVEVSIRRPSGPITKPRQSVVFHAESAVLDFGVLVAYTDAPQDLAYMFEVLVWVVRVDQNVI